MDSASKYRWQTILFCMGGAMVFWLLNALNKVYTTDIDHPVVFVIDESKVVFTKVPPSTLCLEVTGGGWKLLKYLLHLHVQPIELSIDKVSERGQIRSEHLCPIVAKKLKDLKVHKVLMQKPLCVHTPSQTSPTD